MVLEKNAFKIVFGQTGVIFVNFNLFSFDASEVICSTQSLNLVSFVLVNQNFLIAFDLPKFCHEGCQAHRTDDIVHAELLCKLFLGLHKCLVVADSILVKHGILQAAGAIGLKKLCESESTI